MSYISQKGASGPLSLQANGSFQQSNSADLATLIGSRWDLADGREVILVSAGATDIGSIGVLVQTAALVAALSSASITSFTAYSNNGNVPASAVVEFASTTLTANQYAGGFVTVYSGTGRGQTLRVASHTAVTSGTAVTITFEDGPNTALVAGDRFTLIPQHGSGVVICPTTATNAPVGVTLYPLTAAYYGFVLSKGLVAAISDATVAVVGAPIGRSVTTAGCVTAATGSTGSLAISDQVGRAIVAGVSAEAKPVFLDL